MVTARRKKKSRRKLMAAATGLGAINRFVVLMLENRSFDHLLGYMKGGNPQIDGMSSSDFNYEDPLSQSNKIRVDKATKTALGFDPGHEFDQVTMQLYGPAPHGGANPPSNPAPMSGFVCSSRPIAGADAREVMECFEPHHIPTFTQLAEEFATFNYWYSPLPGPTWPNRFFVHASTSGGLSESPSNLAIVRGFTFKNGTLFDQLSSVGKSWRIYHEDLPQTIGIKSMLRKYVQRGKYFRLMDKFASDVAMGDLPEYTFIEPRYDAFNDFADGNSMHPRNDVAPGQNLIKDVYEAIRNSPMWTDTMLIITFDEHGGFYDHVSPPVAPSTGDDKRYASTKPFAFDRYGVRVPTIVISAHTDRRTVIGTRPQDATTIFDHSSIVATVQKRFGLPSLTKRDAKANTLDIALNRAMPREDDVPKKLRTLRTRKPLAARRMQARPAPASRPLSKDQETFLALAMALDQEMNPAKRKSIMAASAAKRTAVEAAAYASKVQAKALARRGERVRRSPSRKHK